MNELVEEWIEREIGRIHEIRLFPEQGCTSEVRLVETETQSYILKSSYIEKYRNWLRAEAKVLKEGKTGQRPLPTFYGFWDGSDGSHILMSYINGISLTSALKQAESSKEREKLIKGFGEFLNAFHESGKSGKHGKETWLDEQLNLARTYVENGQCDGDLPLLEKLILQRPEPVTQTMIHGDCTTDNVLVVDGEVKMFIDVAGMKMGDPRYDEALAIRKFMHHEKFKDAFYQGYRRHRISESEFEYFNEGLYEFF
ncbi:aminoglycoside phosphotransferase family protein [Rossellomorea aquimaris]|uniref:phosphotransferase family protein n=1 Tax=Rossellomorea aquimaris TaxID=189382 RepID=UPI001CD69056|nr:aminoglycoside phosphotransferase family protein [Rossellomorea aquimaris]MCA1053740.1 aminoglycoside phosphotransferase family protein [Rossellomorea aquimaris]